MYCYGLARVSYTTNAQTSENSGGVKQPCPIKRKTPVVTGVFVNLTGSKCGQFHFIQIRRPAPCCREPAPCGGYAWPGRIPVPIQPCRYGPTTGASPPVSI